MKKLNQLQTSVVEAITSLNGEATLKEIAEKTGKAEKTISNNVPGMLTENILERATRPKSEGKGMEVTYKVKLQEIEGKDGKKASVPPPPDADAVLPGNKPVKKPEVKDIFPEAEQTAPKKTKPVAVPSELENDALSKKVAKQKTVKPTKIVKEKAAPKAKEPKPAKPAKEPKATKVKSDVPKGTYKALEDLQMKPFKNTKESKGEPIEIACRYKGVITKALFLDGVISYKNKEYTPWQLWKELTGMATSAWKKFFYVNKEGKLTTLEEFMPKRQKGL